MFLSFFLLIYPKLCSDLFLWEKVHFFFDNNYSTFVINAVFTFFREEQFNAAAAIRK
jgi:hypothetical protein